MVNTGASIHICVIEGGKMRRLETASTSSWSLSMDSHGSKWRAPQLNTRGSKRDGESSRHDPRIMTLRRERWALWSSVVSWKSAFLLQLQKTMDSAFLGFGMFFRCVETEVIPWSVAASLWQSFELWLEVSLASMLTALAEKLVLLKRLCFKEISTCWRPSKYTYVD